MIFMRNIYTKNLYKNQILLNLGSCFYNFPIQIKLKLMMVKSSTDGVTFQIE